MHSTTPSCKISIIVKALNEERRIAVALESALAAVEPFGGEVILADSCSTDKTIEIALGYPVRVVQLAKPEERCCGIGPQLGYQVSLGEYVYILDGDMEMLPSFLPEAIALMETHPEVAGVGGLVVEMNTTSLEYLARVERGTAHMRAGEVDRLDMGGLYRRVAVEQSGYFSDRNLHSYEEFDLAIRLRAKGWKLQRISEASVRHHGHDAPPYKLLMRRWKTGYINGLGELLRAAAGRPHMKLALQGVRELRIYIFVLAWWAILLILSLLNFMQLLSYLPTILIFLTPFSLMAVRKRSLQKAIFSVTSWCFNAGGLIRGLVSRRVEASTPIEVREIK